MHRLSLCLVTRFSHISDGFFLSDSHYYASDVDRPSDGSRTQQCYRAFHRQNPRAHSEEPRAMAPQGECPRSLRSTTARPILDSPAHQLRRWKSMPNSQLAPPDRALFSCSGCRSDNVHGLVCTWCGAPCDSAAPAAHVRRRRVSAPHLLTDAQKVQLRMIEQNAAALLVSLHVDAPSAEVTPDSRAVRRRRHRDAAVYSLDNATGLIRTVKFIHLKGVRNTSLTFFGSCRIEARVSLFAR